VSLHLNLVVVDGLMDCCLGLAYWPNVQLAKPEMLRANLKDSETMIELPIVVAYKKH
jgi:hypothetical protein